MKKKIEDHIKWPELTKGKLIKRYKRFLADVELGNGEIVTAHCPNTGSMKHCSDPGSPCYISYHDNPKRKLKYTWELIKMPTSLVGVNTNIPNKLVKTSIDAGVVEELSGYDRSKAEVKISDKSRIDIVLYKDSGEECVIEVKNCTQVVDGVASFPDAVTTRGLKHLVELQKLVKEGKRCVMFYLVQRMDAKHFEPADAIDPDYGKELRKAYKNGVEIVCYDVDINLTRIRLNGPVPFKL